ncbi:glycosyltransferase family 2 protein [Candidatus Peregrinibacteria bacterium]|nr:glycosyltransferase family 2 protein [Candidatus Peregrinibacteria bacterium]
MLSVIIPICNEEHAAERTIRGVYDVLRRAKEQFEIIAVNDGSTDRTAELLRTIRLPHFRVLTHEINRGNGASIMTGANAARGELLATIDADGTYPYEDFPALLALKRTLDVPMIVGARTKKGAAIPWIHAIAKRMLRAVAEHITAQHIADINSGLRIVDRELFESFLAAYPQRFSLHITLTVSALLAGHTIAYEPIDYFPRIGKSHMTGGLRGIRHFFLFLRQMKRISQTRVPSATLATCQNCRSSPTSGLSCACVRSGG